VGAAVGAVVLLGLVAALIFFFAKRRRRRRRVAPPGTPGAYTFDHIKPGLETAIVDTCVTFSPVPSCGVVVSATTRKLARVFSASARAILS
jgi:ABC-type Fe3+ transport system permease subunit